MLELWGALGDQDLETRSLAYLFSAYKMGRAGQGRWGGLHVTSFPYNELQLGSIGEIRRR